MKKGMFVALIIISFMVSSVYAGGQWRDGYGNSGSVSGTAGIKMEDANVPEPKGFTVETSSIIAGNYDVNKSTKTTAARSKGRDGAACSSNDECKGDVCEGGSCCTAHGSSCDSNSHCCGHPSQGCTNGTCPQ